MTNAAGRGSQSIIRENFGPQTGLPVVAVPTGAAGEVVSGPSKSGQTFIVKAFSRVVNTSGSNRTVSFYLVPTGGSAADSNCIGKDMALNANTWMPFGELYLSYGYDIHGLASGSGINLVPCVLVED